MPSVSCARGTCSSIRDMVVIIVERRPGPRRTAPRPETASFRPVGGESYSRPSRIHPAATTSGAPLKRNSPKTAPAAHEPAAYSAGPHWRRLWPCSSAKATVTTSTGRSGTGRHERGHQHLEPRGATADAALLLARVRSGLGGALRGQPEDPTARNTPASSGPASGNHAVESPMEMIGPKMKHTSSMTDSNEYAVCSWGVAVQRGPAGPDHRPHARHAADADTATNSTQSGAPCRRAHQQGARRERISVAGRSTRACPYWSTRRETCRPHRRGQRDGGRQGAGQAVPPGQLRHHGHHADAHHRQRHPAEEPRGGEGLGAGGGEMAR
ncbi:hypothetical protein SSPIM334S_05578 [Streptomyces spiroverticillatus]